MKRAKRDQRKKATAGRVKQSTARRARSTRSRLEALNPGIGFLLGAGFSKHFGLPLATEFVDYARRYRDDPKWKSYPFVHGGWSLTPLIEFAEKCAQSKGRPVSNIEELLRLSKAGHERDSLLRAIFCVLQAAQHEIDDYSDQHDRLNAYLSFLDLALRAGEYPAASPIVTVNYDSVPQIVGYYAFADDLDDTDNWDFHYLLDDSPQAFTDRGGPWPYTIRTFRIYKLHGSITFERCRTHGLQQITDAHRYNVHGTCRAGDCEEVTAPLIVYPESEKRVDEELRRLWREGFEALASCKVIVVIGLAFNETDKDLLAATKKLVSRGRRVVILDPNSPAIARRLPGSLPVMVGPEAAFFHDVFGEKRPAARASFEKLTGWPVQSVQFFKPGGTGKPRSITFPTDPR